MTCTPEFRDFYRKFDCEIEKATRTEIFKMVWFGLKYTHLYLRTI